MALAFGYNRWLTERMLPGDEHVLAMLYLPFNDHNAAYKMVDDFARRDRGGGRLWAGRLCRGRLRCMLGVDSSSH